MVKYALFIAVLLAGCSKPAPLFYWLHNSGSPYICNAPNPTPNGGECTGPTVTLNDFYTDSPLVRDQLISNGWVRESHK